MPKYDAVQRSVWNLEEGRPKINRTSDAVRGCIEVESHPMFLQYATFIIYVSKQHGFLGF